MAWSQFIDRDHQLVVVVHRGVWGDYEPLQHLESWIESAEFLAGMNILRDFRASTLPEAPMHSMVVESVGRIREIDALLGPCRIATVVGSMVDFGRTGVLNLFEEGPVVRQRFVGLRDAKAWLGLPIDYRCALLPED